MKGQGLSVKVLGINEALGLLKDLPTQVTRAGITAAARKAARPIVKESRAIILKEAKGTGEGYSKVRHVARSIKSVSTSKRALPGVRVVTKGAPVRVGRKNWNVQGYAKLLSAGAYKTPGRKGKGEFKGFGNFITEGAKRTRFITNAIFEKHLLTEMEKAVVRARRKYSR